MLPTSFVNCHSWKYSYSVTMNNPPILSGLNISNASRTPTVPMNAGYRGPGFCAWTAIALLLVYGGAFGNLLTLLAILRSQWWKTGIQVLILSMTIGDLLNTFIFYPHQIVNMVFGKVYPWSSQPFCRALGYLTMSINLLVPIHCCMIAINRLVSIVLTGAYKRLTQRRTAVIMCVLSWMIPFVLFIVPLVEVDGTFGNTPMFGYCTWQGWRGSRAMSFAISATTVYFPTAIIFACYMTIFLYLKKTERSVIHVSGDVDVKRRQKAGSRRRIQVAKMMLVTFMVFLVCYIPLTLFFYVGGNLPLRQKEVLFCWLILVYWLGGCCNPVIYSVMNSEFREAYRELFRRLGKRRFVAGSMAQRNGISTLAAATSIQPNNN